MALRDFFGSPEEMELELQRLKESEEMEKNLSPPEKKRVKYTDFLKKEDFEGEDLPNWSPGVKYGLLIEDRVLKEYPNLKACSSYEDRNLKVDIKGEDYYGKFFSQMKKVDGMFCRSLEEAVKAIEAAHPDKDIRTSIKIALEYAIKKGRRLYLTLVHNSPGERGIAKYTLKHFLIEEVL